MKKAFIASVKDDYLDKVDAVADRLRNKGCQITGILKFTGIITGKVDSKTDLKDLFVDGVATLERERKVRKNENG